MIGLNGLPGNPGLVGAKGLPVSIDRNNRFLKKYTRRLRVNQDLKVIPVLLEDVVNQAHLVTEHTFL